MIRHLRPRIARRLYVIASLLALALLLLAPATSEAHALLLRSDPGRDAKLTTPPTQVRMWFSEDLNPTFSTARVVNTSRQRVDINNAHVTSNDPREMDLTLQPNLPPAAYAVVWRTQSAEDGHILTGSFIFYVLRPDGSVPTFNGTLTGQDTLGDSTSNGQLDGQALFSLLMVTLIELGVVFWVGAQLWQTFVLQLIEEPGEEQEAVYKRTEQRFAERFALPALLVMLVANIGVLVGQALQLTSGRWDAALAPALLAQLVTTGQFGRFWLARELVTLLALALALYTFLVKRSPRLIGTLIPWANLFLGLALLTAVVLSGHAAATNRDIIVYAVLVDWLHLLAASLWVGGMMYIATCYLPALKPNTALERTQSLLDTIPRFSPLAIAGILIMTLSGPFNATVHMTSWSQLLSTAYGRSLDIKVILVGALLLTSAYHVGLLRPRLQKTYKHYQNVLAEEYTRDVDVHTDEGTSHSIGGIAQQVKQHTGEQNQLVKQLETRIAQQTRRFTRILTYEPLLGVAVLVCTGLMTIFAGTLQPATTAAANPQPVTPIIKPYTTTVLTKDKKFKLNITISPDRFGPNDFTATIFDSQGKPIPPNTVGISLYTTMLDMDMGTSPALNLQPDGKGHYVGSGDLDMPGNWQLRVVVRTLDNTLHEGTVKFYAGT